MKYLFVSILLLFNIACGNPKYYINATPHLNLREAPNTNSKIISKIPNGEEVFVIKHDNKTEIIDGEKGKWVQVQWKEKQGWVFNAYLNSNNNQRNNITEKLKKAINNNKNIVIIFMNETELKKESKGLDNEFYADWSNSLNKIGSKTELISIKISRQAWKEIRKINSIPKNKYSLIFINDNADILYFENGIIEPYPVEYVIQYFNGKKQISKENISLPDKSDRSVEEILGIQKYKISEVLKLD